MKKKIVWLHWVVIKRVLKWVTFAWYIRVLLRRVNRVARDGEG